MQCCLVWRGDKEKGVFMVDLSGILIKVRYGNNEIGVCVSKHLMHRKYSTNKEAWYKSYTQNIFKYIHTRILQIHMCFSSVHDADYSVIAVHVQSAKM